MYEALDEKVAMISTFTGGGGSFETRGFDPANHSLIAGVGVTFTSKDNFELIGRYDMESKADYIDHSAQLHAVWAF